MYYFFCTQFKIQYIWKNKDFLPRDNLQNVFRSNRAVCPSVTQTKMSRLITRQPPPARVTWTRWSPRASPASSCTAAGRCCSSPVAGGAPLWRRRAGAPGTSGGRGWADWWWFRAKSEAETTGWLEANLCVHMWNQIVWILASKTQ